MATKHVVSRTQSRTSIRKTARRALWRAVEELENRLLLSTFTVTSTADSGAGSLRQAIIQANNNPGSDTIRFSIAGAGVKTIAPLSDLPTITDTLTIDGTSQPGYAGKPLIQISGNANRYAGLWIRGNNSVVTGLCINGFPNSGVRIEGCTGVTIRSNYIGTDPTGSVSRPNGIGVLTGGVSATTIGGGVGDGNLISGNALYGVLMSNSNSVVIAANRIGTDAAGAAAVPNAVFGIHSIGSSDIRIGMPGSGNVISGNGAAGIFFEGYYYVAPAKGQVVANLIGTAADGVTALGNGGDGILASGRYGPVDLVVGSDSNGLGNTIAFNGGAGAASYHSVGLRIRGNSIYSNSGKGIDWSSVPVADQLLPPVISTIGYGDQTNLTGAFLYQDSGAKTYTLDFYANPATPVGTQPQGKRYLGSTTVSGDSSNYNTYVPFDITLLATTLPGEIITATVTDPDQSTSEFSGRIMVGMNALPETANEGDFVTLQGIGADMGGDPVTLTWSINGTPLEDHGNTVNLGLTGGDKEVTLTVTNSAGQSASMTSRISVPDVPPTVYAFSNSGTDMGFILPGQEVTVVVNFSDPGIPAGETYLAYVDWGDGSWTIPDQVASGTTATLTGVHTYSSAGIFEPVLALFQTRVEGGGWTSLGKVYVTGVSAVDGAITIVGTGGDDDVQILENKDGSVDVEASFLDAPVHISRDHLWIWDSTIFAYLGDGNDAAGVSGPGKTQAIIYGGNGNDFLKAGQGDAMLIGGEGEDQLIGGGGFNILVGGSVPIESWGDLRWDLYYHQTIDPSSRGLSDDGSADQMIAGRGQNLVYPGEKDKSVLHKGDLLIPIV